jgi:cell division protein FtsW
MNMLGARKYGQRRQFRLNNDQAGIRKHRPDYFLLVIMAALLVVGAVVVYAIGPGLTHGKNLPESYFTSKQLTAIALGIVGFILASRIPLKRWKTLQWPVIILAVIVALLVRVVGEEINGAHRWIQVAGFSFQAAELIKLAIVLWLSNYLFTRMRSGEMASNKVLKTLGIVCIGLYLVVAELQSDLGSAAVMVAVIAISAFVAGLPMRRMMLVAIAGLLFASVAILSTPYRRDRVATFLNPVADCQAEGYQACQALITIGSGGLFGKGLGRSVQAYGYLPEPANDSIFAIVAEKFGFVGASIVVALFWLLFRRIAVIARSAPDEYTRLLVTGVLVWLSVQMAINIGAMVGLLPLKGITLPFVSYGGTSIIFVMIAMGIVFEASRYTDLQTQKTMIHTDIRKQSPNDRRPSIIRYGRTK